MNELSDLCTLGTRRELSFTEQALGTDDMQDKDLVSVMAIENATRRLHDLTVTGLPKLLWPTATLRVLSQLLDVVENAFDKL